MPFLPPNQQRQSTEGKNRFTQRYNSNHTKFCNKKSLSIVNLNQLINLKHYSCILYYFQFSINWLSLLKLPQIKLGPQGIIFKDNWLEFYMPNIKYCKNLNVRVPLISQAKQNREIKGHEYQIIATPIHNAKWWLAHHWTIRCSSLVCVYTGVITHELRLKSICFCFETFALWFNVFCWCDIIWVWGSSVAEWLACWTQAQKGLESNRSRDAVR